MKNEPRRTAQDPRRTGRLLQGAAFRQRIVPPKKGRGSYKRKKQGVDNGQEIKFRSQG